MIQMNTTNIGKAILNSNMTQEDKIAALVAMSRPKHTRSGSDIRQAMMECLFLADHPVRICELRETLGKDIYWAGTFTQQMKLLAQYGAVKVRKVETGNTILVNCGRLEPVEVPERYNVYSLNI